MMEASGAIVFLPRESGGDGPLLFQDILFCPAAVWLRQALEEMGAKAFFVVCHGDDRERAAAFFPPDTEVVTTGAEDAPQRLQGFLDRQSGAVAVVTRPVYLDPDGTGVPFSAEPKGQVEGVWTVDARRLAQALEEGQAFEIALRARGLAAPAGVAYPLHPRTWELAEQLARSRRNARLMADGVRMIDAGAVYVDPTVTVGRGTVLLPGTILRGKTEIGAHCEIGPNTMITDCAIGARVTINASQLSESTVEEGAKIGPFAYIRPHCHVGKNVKVGDFVELKNSVIGEGTKISHLTYVGDSDVGGRVNFGCGTVTVNYDGSAKFRTTIGDDAFIGCNTNLVAPVRVGAGAYTAAGSTITDDVPDDSLAIARSPQTIKVQWAAKRRKVKK